MKVWENRVFSPSDVKWLFSQRKLLNSSLFCELEWMKSAIRKEQSAYIQDAIYRLRWKQWATLVNIGHFPILPVYMLPFVSFLFRLACFPLFISLFRIHPYCNFLNILGIYSSQKRIETRDIQQEKHPVCID